MTPAPLLAALTAACDSAPPAGSPPGTGVQPTDSGSAPNPPAPTADTAAPTDSATAIVPCPPGDGAFISTTEVRCNAPDDHVQYAMCTSGPSCGGWVFAQETGNAEPNWSDAHTLEVVAADPGGAWTELVRRLATQAGLSDWEPDVSTLFACGAHLEDPAVMTFAFVALDGAGEPADCVVWGQDPVALIDGTLVRVNDPPLPLRRCRVLP